MAIEDDDEKVEDAISRLDYKPEDFGLNMRGAVNLQSELPKDAEAGDSHWCLEDEHLWVFDGSVWQVLGSFNRDA